MKLWNLLTVVLQDQQLASTVEHVRGVVPAHESKPCLPSIPDAMFLVEHVPISRSRTGLFKLFTQPSWGSLLCLCKRFPQLKDIVRTAFSEVASKRLGFPSLRQH